MSIENKLLYKVLETKDWDTIVEKGITPNYFTGANRRAFKWLGNFKVSYSSLPDIETFKKHFPEISLDNAAKEPLGYYCDEVRKKVKQNKLASVLEKSVERINNGEIDECYQDISRLLLDVNTEFTFSEKVDLGTKANERFAEYEQSKLTGGITGYPIGINPIDKQTGGMKDVDLFTFLAPSGKGKTWLLCVIASNLIRAGYRVLFLTKEMSPHQILKRMDSILANVSYNRLKNGKLTKAEEETYKNYLENYAPRYSDKLSIELVINGVNECASKVDTFRPDVLLVDGGYLMSEGADPEDWKAVISVWKAFKLMALGRKVPVILTSQLTDKNTIAYSTGLKQYCDGMWVLKQDEVQRASKEVSIETLKIRDGEWNPSFTMNWDWSEMKYDVVFSFDTEKDKFFTVQDSAINLTKIS